MVALLALAVVVALVAAPVVLVTQQVGREAAHVLDFVQEELAGGRWRDVIGSRPWLAAVLAWLESYVELDAIGQRAAEKAETMAPAVVGATIALAIQVLVAAFTLFYFFRDRGLILDGVRAVLPLSDVEAIHATVFAGDHHPNEGYRWRIALTRAESSAARSGVIRPADLAEQPTPTTARSPRGTPRHRAPPGGCRHDAGRRS